LCGSERWRYVPRSFFFSAVKRWDTFLSRSACALPFVFARNRGLMCSFSFQRVIKYDHTCMRDFRSRRAGRSSSSRHQKAHFLSIKSTRVGRWWHAYSTQSAKVARSSFVGAGKSPVVSLRVFGCVALSDFLPQNFPPRTRKKRYHACLFARVGVPSAFRRLLLFFFVRKVKDLLRIVLL